MFTASETCVIPNNFVLQLLQAVFRGVKARQRYRETKQMKIQAVLRIQARGFLHFGLVWFTGPLFHHVCGYAVLVSGPTS